MKKFTMLLLGVIFVTLIAGSVQSVTADHLFEDENVVNYVSTKDSEYQIHAQIQVRNEQGQLVSISEGTHGQYIPLEITDYVFNEKLGKKEIVTVDNIKYEKVQYTNTSEITTGGADFVMESAFLGSLWVNFCGEIGGHGSSCIPIFGVSLSVGVISETDVITNQWTILRELN